MEIDDQIVTLHTPGVSTSNVVTPRVLADTLIARAGPFPVVFLTGPRQAGKTTLARATFPDFLYVSLEDLERREAATEDPRGFLRRLEGRGGVILDEVQRTPDLFSYLQGFVDEARGGPLILTGSQHFLLSESISQTLAGRAAILELLPLSASELLGTPARAPETVAVEDDDPPAPGRDLDETLLTGFFPRIHARSLPADAWLDGYVQTYVERDVRTLANVGDLDTFTRFLRLCAGRSGCLLNLASLAADTGVSHDTARRWLSILRASYVVDLLPPHLANFNRRLVKSPKLYFTDTGLLCFLLGLHDPGQVALHPLRGAIFETFVHSELRKRFLHHGRRPPLYFWRDSNGREVDFVLDLGTRRVPIEVKAGETVRSDAFKTLDLYARLADEPGGVLVYGGTEAGTRGPHRVRPWFACT